MKRITNHKEVMELMQEHGGRPAVIEDPTTDGGALGLRVDFSGKEDEKNLSQTKESAGISWERFFEIFDQENLALVYDPNEEEVTYMFRFIKRENENVEEDDSVQRFREAIQGGQEENFVLEDVTRKNVPGPVGGASGN